MTIQTIAAAVDFLICRAQPLTQVGTHWYLDGQHLSGKELLALARQLDGGDGVSKYGNTRTEHEGHVFASLAECMRYQELRLMEQAGEISGLEFQPRYELQPAFVDGDGVRHRPIFYIGDFAFVEKGRLVCEDTKGMATDVYRLKIKLAKHVYPHVSFREVKV